MYSIADRLGHAIGIALLFTLAAASAQDEAEAKATVKRVQAYLEKFSTVMDSEEGRGRVLISTKLITDDSQGEFELMYERTDFKTTETPMPSIHQLIYYPFKLNDLNAASVVVREWAGAISGRKYYFVSSQVDTQKEFIDYTNIFQQLHPDGKVEVSTSHGKARTLVLGYFKKEEEARRFLDLFKDLLTQAGDREEVSPPKGGTTVKKPPPASLTAFLLRNTMSGLG